MLQTEHHQISTPDGWLLSVRRALCEPQAPGEAARPADGPPLAIVPGYGMNSFIFGFHPTGRSFVEALRDGGSDVWCLDMRGQGESRYTGGGCPLRRLGWGLAELAFTDLKCALEHIARVTGYERVDTIGCSLGGSLVYAYAARFHGERLGRVVAMGAPLLMVRPHPALRLASLAGPLLGLLPMRGTRRMARYGLPLLARHLPRALSIYMNADIVDTSRAAELCQTVEDPRRRINREVARWIRRGRLVADGMDVARGLRGLQLPCLLVIASGDGIVNPATCRSVTRYLGSEQVSELVVGDVALHVAHADLFVSDIADEQVFQPIISWLRA